MECKVPFVIPGTIAMYLNLKFVVFSGLTAIRTMFSDQTAVYQEALDTKKTIRKFYLNNPLIYMSLYRYKLYTLV